MSYIRLVEDRRRKKQQGRDWGYIILFAVVWFGLILAPPAVRAWASYHW
jgi:hypothetical protein